MLAIISRLPLPRQLHMHTFHLPLQVWAGLQPSLPWSLQLQRHGTAPFSLHHCQSIMVSGM